MAASRHALDPNGKPFLHPVFDVVTRVGKPLPRPLHHLLEGTGNERIHVESSIPDVPDKPGEYPVALHLLNKQDAQLGCATYTVTVLPKDAPRTYTQFTPPTIKLEHVPVFNMNTLEYDRWNYATSTPLKLNTGETPFTGLKVEKQKITKVADPVMIKKTHDGYFLWVNNVQDATPGPMPYGIKITEPDGTQTTRFGTVQIGDKREREITGIEPNQAFAVGDQVNLEFTITNGKTNEKIYAHNLPEGLKITGNGAKAAISGAPTKAGYYEVPVFTQARFGNRTLDTKILKFSIGEVGDIPKPKAQRPHFMRTENCPTNPFAPKQPPAPQPPVPGPQPPATPKPTTPPAPPANPAPPVNPAQVVQANRISGESRIETAVATSQLLNPAQSQTTVLVARADQYADAVAATPLAQHLGASVLLTQPDTLHPATQAELRRALKPNANVILLGQTAALSANVENQIKRAMPSAVISRVGGTNRYATAANIYDRMGKPARVALVDGDNTNLADALVAGAAMAKGGAVLFTANGNLAPESKPIVQATQVTSAFSYDPTLQATAKVKPIAGSDAIERAITTAKELFNQGFTRVAVASAKEANSVDALAGGAAAARHGAPLLLVPDSTTDRRVSTYLAPKFADTSLKTIDVFGGPKAITPEVAKTLLDPATTVEWHEYTAN